MQRSASYLYIYRGSSFLVYPVHFILPGCSAAWTPAWATSSSWPWALTLSCSDLEAATDLWRVVRCDCTSTKLTDSIKHSDRIIQTFILTFSYDATRIHDAVTATLLSVKTGCVHGVRLFCSIGLVTCTCASRLLSAHGHLHGGRGYGQASS